ncbi:glycoside hydrolase family 16 protein [Moniliophthora roreri MCA 2997]|uniref:Glycoside hydrolase family 16 protein n=2 Tax=Moniliophthora roreri TaxID=221103 RepID=V2X1D1_MONRO|nr:glycoside hydrolase family 16 protein [Moniliophthora roreri MCA 2997]
MRSSLPICILLLLLDATSPTNARLDGKNDNFLLRAHGVAARHTKGLADDLRVAFGAVLPISHSSSQTGYTLSRRQQDVLGNNRVVYCKSGGARSGGLGTGSNGDSGTGTDGSGNGGNTTTTTRGGSSGGGGTRTSTTAAAQPTQTFNSPYRLIEEHAGSSFFEGWDFWTLSDPTHGTVDYIGEQDGRAQGLIELNDAGNTIMRVETTPQVDMRKSIRIQTKLELNKGLWIMDAVHMPTGCGTWPAFWLNGPQWPITGEIDIVEGVHDYTNNQATIHTDIGCTLSSSSSSTLGISGNLVGPTNCAADQTANQGCGVRDTSSVSFGAPFNRNGGGAYAGEVTSQGVKIWFWPRGSIPADVEAGTPVPSTWGTPVANWAAGSCNPDRYFVNQAAIFDTTFCGDWAGPVWNDAGAPGQEQSCAARTGVSTCEEYVRTRGSTFTEAYWEVKYVRIFQLK